MNATIGIVGAGTMGSGIAEVAALAKLKVLLHDTSEKALTTALDRIRQSLNRSVEKNRLGADEATEVLARISPAPDLNALATSVFIVEAAMEDLDVKREIFQKLDAILPRSVILATNTSSLSVTSIAATTNRPDKVIGMHFFNPPPLMKLVEVITGKHTSGATVVATMDLALAMQKTPVACTDTPGFIVNRIARPFYGEALRLLGEGVASVEDIDRIVTREGGFKMGPFDLMDLIGIDINYAVTKSVYEQFFQEPRFRPHPIQRQMVEAGTLGRKTGKGFYSYKHLHAAEKRKPSSR